MLETVLFAIPTAVAEHIQLDNIASRVLSDLPDGVLRFDRGAEIVLVECDREVGRSLAEELRELTRPSIDIKLSALAARTALLRLDAALGETR